MIVALVAVITIGATAVAFAQSRTADVEVRIWRSASDHTAIYWSARPAGGSWSELGTHRVQFNDAARWQYEDIEIAVPLATPAVAFAQSRTADVEVRIWRSASDHTAIYWSARPAGGSWSELGTHRVQFNDAARWQYEDIEIAVPLATPVPTATPTPSPTATPAVTSLRALNLIQQEELRRLAGTIEEAKNRFYGGRGQAMSRILPPIQAETTRLEAALKAAGCSRFNTNANCEELESQLEESRGQVQKIRSRLESQTRNLNAYFNTVVARMTVIHQREENCYLGTVERGCDLEKYRTEIWEDLARIDYQSFTEDRQSFNSDSYLR